MKWEETQRRAEPGQQGVSVLGDREVVVVKAADRSYSGVVGVKQLQHQEAEGLAAGTELRRAPPPRLPVRGLQGQRDQSTLNPLGTGKREVCWGGPSPRSDLGDTTCPRSTLPSSQTNTGDQGHQTCL